MSRPGVTGFVALDWKDDRLVGIEVLDADKRLRPDLLDQAEGTPGLVLRLVDLWVDRAYGLVRYDQIFRWPAAVCDRYAARSLRCSAKRAAR